MKKILKRTLLLAVMVMCLFAIFTVATSAATYADDNAAIAGGAVARIGEAGTGTYYATIEDAIAAVPEGGTDPTVITLITDTKWSTASTFTNKAVTIQGVNTGSGKVTLEQALKNDTFGNNASITLENLKVHITERVSGSNSFFWLTGAGVKIKIKNCDFSTTVTNVNFIRIHSSVASAVTVDTLELTNVTFKDVKFTLLCAQNTVTFGSAANPAVFNNVSELTTGSTNDSVQSIVYNDAGNKVTVHIKMIGCNINGTINATNSASTFMLDDVSAKNLGCTYRVGELTSNFASKAAYYADEDAAFASANGATVYDITDPSNPVVVTPPPTCEHVDANLDGDCDSCDENMGAAAVVTGTNTYKYFNTIDEALNYVIANNGYDTIILLKDCAASTSIDRTNAYYIAKTVTIKSNVTDKANYPSLTISHRWNIGRAGKNGHLTLENLKLNLNASSYNLVCDHESGVTFNNLIINTVSSTPVLSNSPSVATYVINGCEITGGSSTEVFSMGWDGTTNTVVIANTTTNVPIFKARASNTKLTLKIEAQYTYTGSGDFVIKNGCIFNLISNIPVMYDNDAAAKDSGCVYRVGETEGGMTGEVYFTTFEDALEVATSTNKVYDISGDVVTVSPHYNLVFGIKDKNDNATGEKITITNGFKVIFPKDGLVHSDLKKSSRDYVGAVKLAQAVNGGTPIRYSDNLDVANSIVVGLCNARAAELAKEIGLNANECAIVVDGNTIYVLALNDQAIIVAADAFAWLINDNNGTLALVKTLKEKVIANAYWVVEEEEPEGATLVGGQNANNNSVQNVYKYDTIAAAKTAYDAYIKKLKTAGYTEVWSNTIGKNIFSFYKSATKALYVALNANEYEYAYTIKNLNSWFDGYYSGYLSADAANRQAYERDYYACIRIVSMPTESLLTLPTNAAPFVPTNEVGASKMVMVGLEASNIGMSYVIRLADGRFIVIDGGANATSNAADGIYDAIDALNGNETQIKLAAWYSSHTHWDHFAGFKSFLDKYGANVTIEYMIANVPASDEVFDGIVELTSTQIEAMQKAVGGFKLLRVHTGQKLYFSNVEIEILKTPEEHGPYNMYGSNDTNIVSRFTFNLDAATKTTILFLGDLQIHGGQTLRNMYGSYLKSDVVQLAHHGNFGPEDLLYRFIAADYVLVPNLTSTFTSHSSKQTYIAAANRTALRIAKYTWAADPGETKVIDIVAGGLSCDKYTNRSPAGNPAHVHSTEVTYNAQESPYHWTECNCGAILNVVSDHVYDNNCDKDCNLCKETRTTEHKYDNACDAECNVCNETRTVGDHEFGEWTVVEEATADKEGSKKRVCSECGHEETETIAKLAKTTGAPEEEKKKGCGGTVTVAGLALIAALGTCAVFV